MSALAWAQRGMNLGHPLKGQVIAAAERVCPDAFAAALDEIAVENPTEGGEDVITQSDVVDALRACGVLA